MPATSSFLPRRIPITPWVSRPVARTSDSTKRMALPRRVAMMTSSEPLVGATQSSSSLSCRLMAIKPLRRTLAYSFIAVFLIVACLVTISM